MNLYLMRHGLAVEKGETGDNSDHDRPLTPKGRQRVQRVAEAFVSLDIAVDTLLSSPLVRARQTAEILLRQWKIRRKLQVTDYLSPGTPPDLLIALLLQLKGAPQEILLVGHEPDLSQFAALLLTGTESLELTFKKAGVAKLAVNHLKAGRCATLEWLLTPRQFERMI
jgi:phosphohistidine phosphatase